MPEYLAPGVYIEEMPSANKAIQGASTSTAGMVGLTERGPVGVPTLITSAGQFKRIFGGLLDPSTYANGTDALPHAVNGFFANGGSRVYVVRAVGTNPGIATIAAPASATTILNIFARSEGAWGDALQATISHAERFNAQIAEHPVNGSNGQMRLASTFGLSVGTTLSIGAQTRVVTAVLPDNIIILNSNLTAAQVTDAATYDPLVATLEAAEAALAAAQDADPGGDHSAEIAAVTAAQADVDGETAKAFAKSVEFDLLVEKMAGGVAFETELFTGLSMNDTSPSYVGRVIGTCDADGTNPSDDGDSQMIRIHVAATTSRPDAGLLSLTGGSDGTVDDTTFVGNPSEDPSERTGIQSLNNEAGISLVAVPGQTSVTVQKALLTHCEQQVYRFAVLDAPAGSKLKEVQTHRGEYDSTRAALYYPWLQIAAPFGPKGELHAIPPSGHMLGVYARTDNSRGVWKAPANEVVRNVLGFDIKVNKGEQDILNPIHVNCLRDFRAEQRGLRVWGARTLSSNPEWRYVPVRRTFLFIEQSLDAGLQWAVFEPNAKPLWDTVKQSITGFLDSIWRQGGLAGVTQEQAFFVNVGFGITMEQADLDNGRLIVEVGIAPVNPAEFVIIRISQKTLEAAG